MIAHRYADHALALLRIFAGASFATHGAQKLLGMFNNGSGLAMTGQTQPLGSMMGIAGLIELVGGLLICLGLFTRPAAFIASGQMAVAFFMAHVSKGGIFPIENRGEGAMLFCFIFLLIAAAGPGRWALDNVFFKRGEEVALDASGRASSVVKAQPTVIEETTTIQR